MAITMVNVLTLSILSVILTSSGAIAGSVPTTTETSEPDVEYLPAEHKVQDIIIPYRRSNIFGDVLPETADSSAETKGLTGLETADSSGDLDPNDDLVSTKPWPIEDLPDPNDDLVSIKPWPVEGLLPDPSDDFVSHKPYEGEWPETSDLSTETEGLAEPDPAYSSLDPSDDISAKPLPFYDEAFEHPDPYDGLLSSKPLPDYDDVSDPSDDLSPKPLPANDYESEPDILHSEDHDPEDSFFVPNPETLAEPETAASLPEPEAFAEPENAHLLPEPEAFAEPGDGHLIPEPEALAEVEDSHAVHRHEAKAETEKTHLSPEADEHAEPRRIDLSHESEAFAEPEDADWMPEPEVVARPETVYLPEAEAFAEPEPFVPAFDQTPVVSKDSEVDEKYPEVRQIELTTKRPSYTTLGGFAAA